MPGPIITFQQLEELVGNLDDGRLGALFNDPESLGIGVPVPQILTDTEMKGRNQVRAAIKAMSPQPEDTVSARNYGEFMQGGGEGELPGGPDVQNVASGGLIGYQEGGGVEDRGWNREDEGFFGALGRGAMGLGLGATDWQGLKDQGLMKTAGHAALMGLGFLGPGGWALRGAAKALPWLGRAGKGIYGLRTAEGLGRGTLGLASKPGWKGAFGRRLLGKQSTGYDPSRITRSPWRGWGQGSASGSGFVPAAELGMTAARRGAIGGGLAGLAGYGMFGSDASEKASAAEQGLPTSEEELTMEEMILERLKTLEEGRGRGGGGGQGALYNDIGKVAGDRLARFDSLQDWLRTQTDEEKAVEDLQMEMAGRLEGRIDPERDRRDALASLAGSAARSITAEGRGRGGGADIMADAIDKQIAMGKSQREARQDLEDQAFRFRAMGPEAAAMRSRKTTAGEADTVLSELQGDMAQLTGIDLSTSRQLSGIIQNARMQIERGQAFDPQMFEVMLNMGQQLYEQKIWPKERLDAMAQTFSGLMEQRLNREAAGYGQDVTTRLTQ